MTKSILRFCTLIILITILLSNHINSSDSKDVKKIPENTTVDESKENSDTSVEISTSSSQSDKESSKTIHEESSSQNEDQPNNDKTSLNNRVGEDKDKFTKEMREEYTYWIKFKNSFSFPKDQKAKLARSYRPEEKDYRYTVQAYNWFFYLTAGILGIFLVIYLIGRFLKNYFKGPKEHITNWYSRISFSMIFIGFVLFVTFNGIALNKILSVK